MLAYYAISTIEILYTPLNSRHLQTLLCDSLYEGVLLASPLHNTSRDIEVYTQSHISQSKKYMPLDISSSYILTFYTRYLVHLSIRIDKDIRNRVTSFENQ